MPKVSIVVPVYKVEPYLDRCVQSLRNQALEDIEIILVDDGSPDRCPEMCDVYAKQDSRIVVIHQSNKGVAAARNRGIEAANSDYVTFVDGDDYVDSNMYLDMFRIAVENDCDVVLCDCVKEYDKRTLLYSHDIRGGYYNREQLEKEYFPHLIMMENIEYPATISNWLILYRMRQSDKLYPTGLVRYVEGIRYSEDLLFGAQILFNANSFYYLRGKAYYHYCMNSNSVTHTFNKEKWTDYKILIDGAERYFLHGEGGIFKKQIDYMVLFFVFNMLSDINRAEELTKNEKRQFRSDVLTDKRVIKMFHELKISQLYVPWKLKIRTYQLKLMSNLKGMR